MSVADYRMWKTNDGGTYYGAYQFFWRCAHYPSAIDNFFAGRTHACPICNTPPRWHDNGDHQPRGETR